MWEHRKARAPAGTHSGGSDRVAASIAELTAMSLLAPPCCGHIALCDGACRDARRNDGDRRATRIADDRR